MGATQSGTIVTQAVITALPDRAVWNLEKVLCLVTKTHSWGVLGEVREMGLGVMLELHLSVLVDGTELDWVLSEFAPGSVESSDDEEGVEELFWLEA